MKKRLISLLLVLAAVVSLLAGCGRAPGDAAGENAPAATEETVPPTVPADGNPGDVTCLGTYTAEDGAVASAADTVIATAGEAELTIGQLQVYYWLAVADYRLSSLEGEPDFSRPLDTQVCSLDSSVNSWQQYFLREALNTWHTHQALVLQAELEGVPTEEAYQPDEEKHTQFLADKPATKYLYGYSDSYLPNEMHQAYLDGIAQTLDTLATDNGFADAQAQAQAIAGASADSQDLVNYTHTANLAYMYFTELSYGIEPTEEEVGEYYDLHQAAYQDAGITKSGDKTVNLRHILLIPDDAEVAADGTVTCSEESWEACLRQAKQLVEDWDRAVRKTRFSQYAPMDVRESRFSEAAKDHSADPGSRANGGLYLHLRRGQLMEELDDWCFDDARQYADMEILRTRCGYHILFYAGATEEWYAAAQEDLIRNAQQERIRSAMEAHPITVDYSAILLGQAEDNGSFVTPSDLLYPDVAHERYPSMPLYLQQDYPDAPYGDYKLSTHGCGITTLAMVASYMTDEELTPPELAAQYGYYCGLRGTEIVIFDDTPAQMGFHLMNRTYSWAEIDAALKNGQVVVSLQWAGYWTRGGHYLAITKLTEDGKYVVRDSNLLNYSRLSAHVEDCHTRGSIAAASQYYWIYEKKVTHIPACIRCGPDSGETAIAGLFREDYHCAKCLEAMDRREVFLACPAQ